MTIRLRLRPESEQDLADAAEQREWLGNQFLDEVLSVFSVISETPLMFPTVHRNIRRALIHHFPLGVYYRVGGAEIVVLAVMHGSRDPRRWKSRT